MNRDKELKRYVDNAKDIIAKNKGFSDDVMGSSWNFAMGVTHRTKNQITMYEQTLTFMADVIFDLKEKLFANSQQSEMEKKDE